MGAAANIFSVTTLLISIPVAEILFVYIATLYGGSIRLTTPMLWALAFIGEFLLGGVTGIFLGSSGADTYFHDTYFVLAHFHYTFFPITFIAVFVAMTYWFPKMFGRYMNEAWGKVHFWGTIGSHAVHPVVAPIALGFAWLQMARNKLAPGLFFGAQTFWYSVVLLWPIIYVRVYF